MQPVSESVLTIVGTASQKDAFTFWNFSYTCVSETQNTAF